MLSQHVCFYHGLLSDMPPSPPPRSPRHPGHIGLSVPSVEAACKRFEELGVEFVKKPSDGKMR